MNLPDTFSRVQLITIDAAHEGQRVDNFLITCLKGVPKSRIYRILRKGEVRVNKGRVKPEYKLCDGDIVRVPPIRVSDKPKIAKPSKQLTKTLEASVIFENDDLLVVNKPSGLAVHGGSGINLGLIESFRQMRPESRFLELVHRLDRETSGCILLAKKRSALRYIQQELREGRIQKIYQALVVGRWPKRRVQINTPLVKNQLAGGERIVRVATDDTSGAKSCLTQYRIIERFEGCTLVEARPITGRTHQIRVHCQSIGCSIIGDDKYSDDEVNKMYRQWGLKRLFLHAWQLQFRLPDKTSVVVEAPLGDDLTKVFGHLKSM